LDPSQIDAGTIAALMIRFKDSRLPRARRLLDKVNGGETLSDYDMWFLKKIFEDARNTQPLVRRNPEYTRLVAGAIDLYSEIISKGLENQKNS
jgi:hypothetical protein